MSSLFKGGGEESNRVQRVKTKLEMWKVQAVDTVCGKYFHHPNLYLFLSHSPLPLIPSFTFIILQDSLHPSLPFNSFSSSFLTLLT